MINLVKLALRRPYTMAIAAMLIVLMGVLTVQRMVVDIFPTIDIPVVYVAWSFNGLNAEDMERRVVLVSERSYSTTVNGVDRIESLSIPGQGILKIYFQRGTDIGGAIAQISAQSNAILRIAPPGMQPPNIIQFNASNVPVVQVTLNSKTLPEQMLSDWANQFLRLRLFTIPGLSIPPAHRRQAAPDHRRGRSQQGEFQGPLADGRRQRARHHQCDRAGRDRAHRAKGIQYPAQFQSATSGAVQRTSDRHPGRRSGAARRYRQDQRQLRPAD